MTGKASNTRAIFAGNFFSSCQQIVMALSKRDMQDDEANLTTNLVEFFLKTHWLDGRFTSGYRKDFQHVVT